MCEFCGLSGKCGVCGWDQGSVGERAVRLVDDIVMQVVGGVGDGVKRHASPNVGINDSGKMVTDGPLGWGSLCDLDNSLMLDARAAADERLREFCESIVVDVRYAGKQCSKHGGESRALDALERVNEKLTAALVSVGSEWA